MSHCKYIQDKTAKMLALCLWGLLAGCSAIIDTQECATDEDCAVLALPGQVLQCGQGERCQEQPGAQCAEDVDCEGGECVEGECVEGEVSQELRVGPPQERTEAGR